MVVCTALDPVSLGANAGISYFGHHRLTVAPFELGMFATAYFLLQAEKEIRSDGRLAFLYSCLILISVGVIGIAIAPAVGNGLLDKLHRVFGSLTFITQLVLSARLIMRFKIGIFGWAAYVLQFIGGIIALIYLQPAQGFSIQGQLLFQLAFGIILALSLPHLEVEGNS